MRWCLHMVNVNYTVIFSYFRKKMFCSRLLRNMASNEEMACNKGREWVTRHDILRCIGGDHRVVTKLKELCAMWISAETEEEREVILAKQLTSKTRKGSTGARLKSYLSKVLLREQNHIDLFCFIAARCNATVTYRLPCDIDWENHDWSKTNMYKVITVTWHLTDGLTLGKPNKHEKDENLERLYLDYVQQHYRAEPHHPEYQKLNQVVTGLNLCIETAIDRLTRCVDENGGRVDMKQLTEQYLPNYDYGPAEHRKKQTENYITAVRYYARQAQVGFMKFYDLLAALEPFDSPKKPKTDRGTPKQKHIVGLGKGLRSTVPVPPAPIFTETLPAKSTCKKKECVAKKSSGKTKECVGTKSSGIKKEHVQRSTAKMKQPMYTFRYYNETDNERVPFVPSALFIDSESSSESEPNDV